MSRTKLRILFLEFEYEVLCRLQAESEAVMGLINKEKVLRGVGKAVDAANNAADKVHDYAKEKELEEKMPAWKRIKQRQNRPKPFKMKRKNSRISCWLKTRR